MTYTQFAGESRHTFTTVPRVLIFVHYQNKILLLKGAPTKTLWANKYNGVGGHVEPAETVKAAARRELAEETGITQVDPVLCGMVSIDSPGNSASVLLFVFSCRVDSPTIRSGDEGALEWFPWDNLPSDNMMPDLPLLLPHVQQAIRTNQPFYALYTYATDGSFQITLTD